MSLEIFQNVLTGSLGALAFLCIAVWALVKGIVHPDRAYQAQLERVSLLEGENSRLNGSVIELTQANTRLQVDLAKLGTEVEHLREELNKLWGAQHAR